MKFLQIVKLAVSMLPLVIQAIKAIEEAIPGQGAGEKKLAAVRGILESAWDVADDVQDSFESAWPVLSSMVCVMVKAFNGAGVFVAADEKK